LLSLFYLGFAVLCICVMLTEHGASADSEAAEKVHRMIMRLQAWLMLRRCLLLKTKTAHREASVKNVIAALRSALPYGAEYDYQVSRRGEQTKCASPLALAWLMRCVKFT